MKVRRVCKSYSLKVFDIAASTVHEGVPQQAQRMLEKYVQEENKRHQRVDVANAS